MKNMKKFLVNLSLVVIFAVGLSSIVFAAEAEAAKKIYATETNKDKIYFPWNTFMEKEINLPIDCSDAYHTFSILDDDVYGAKFKLTYDKKIINAKVVRRKNERDKIEIIPKKVGTTNLKVEVTADGFNKFTRTIKVNVSKKGTKSKDTYAKRDHNIYEKEYYNPKTVKLVELNKLYNHKVNAARSGIKLSEFYDNESEKKEVLGTLEILTDNNYDKEFLGKLKQDKSAQKFANNIYEQLQKSDELDNLARKYSGYMYHNYRDELDVELEYEDKYKIMETSLIGFPGRDRAGIYYGDFAIYGNEDFISYFDYNIIGTVMFKTNSNTIMCITTVGTDYQTDEKIDAIKELEKSLEDRGPVIYIDEDEGTVYYKDEVTGEKTYIEDYYTDVEEDGTLE